LVQWLFGEPLETKLKSPWVNLYKSLFFMVGRSVSLPLMTDMEPAVPRELYIYSTPVDN